MAIDERARHQLHARLEQVLGTSEATTLMEYLPPTGWADVATKRDLDHLADRLRVEFHRELHREVGGLRSEIASQGRNLFFGVLASNATLVGLVFAAVKLA